MNPNLPTNTVGRDLSRHVGMNANLPTNTVGRDLSRHVGMNANLPTNTVGRDLSRHIGMNADLREQENKMTYSDLRKGRFSQTGAIYHISTVTKNRTPYFSSLYNGRKVVKELMTLQNEGRAETLCYVVMPDHLHWLMTLHNGTLSDAVRLLKGRSARAIGHAIWQANYFDHAVRKEEDMRQLARYIVANPLRANVVKHIGDYSLWDAIWLEETLLG